MGLNGGGLYNSSGQLIVNSPENIEALQLLKEAGYKGEMPELPGEVAMAWATEDATSAARGLHEFGKKYEGLTILGGVFEGSYLDASGMKAIATIPPVPVLRGMFVNVINSPIQRFAIAMSEVAKQKTA